MTFLRALSSLTMCFTAAAGVAAAQTAELIGAEVSAYERLEDGDEFDLALEEPLHGTPFPGACPGAGSQLTRAALRGLEQI